MRLLSSPIPSHPFVPRVARAIRAVYLALVCVAAAQAEEQQTLFVAPMTADEKQISFWQPALGRGLAEMLITELGKLNKFQMLESTALEQIKDEIKLGDEGYVADGEKVEKGGWKGSDYMFRGVVTRFGSKESGVGVGGGLLGTGGGVLGIKTSQNEVRIDWRIVDTYNRTVLSGASGSAVGIHKGTGFNVGGIGGRAFGGLSFNNKEFMDSALGKATVKAINEIIEQVRGLNVPPSSRRQKMAQDQKKASDKQAAEATAAKAVPGKVIAMRGTDTLVVTLGAKNGVKAGDKLMLYQIDEIKDDKGAVVFEEEKLVGEVTVQSVQDERSMARYEGDKKVAVGWKVRAK